MTPTITQADRDAAAKIISAAELRPLILSGRFDEHQYVQAFATHREAEAARIVEWLNEVIKEHEKNSERKGQIIERKHHISACACIIDAIESGEHNLPPAK